MKNYNEAFMRRAIELSRQSVEEGQTPFGAVIVKDGKVIAEGHNTVWRDHDPTAHGEVNTIRLAAKTLGTINLQGCEIYSSCEPCPMCFSAIHWANLDALYYGAGIADAEAAGFREMMVSNEQLKKQGNCRVKIYPGLLREEAAQVLKAFAKQHKSRLY